MKKPRKLNSEKKSFVAYMEGVEMRIRQFGPPSTADHYRSTLSKLRRYLLSVGMPEIPFAKISPSFIESFEGWLRQQGLARNTTSFYLRILRAVYRRAVADGLTPDRKPFLHVYTGVERTRKRALTLDTLQRLRNLDLSSSPRLSYARDIFLFSFYLRGMSFIDMAYLRKQDLRDGRISYHRRKTGGLLQIRWTEEMEQLLRRYPDSGGAYLLPIFRGGVGPTMKDYRNAANRINGALKKIAQLLGLPGDLTLYAARHSWASVAYSRGVPVSIISEGMGHDSESTTRIYLASLDSAEVDRANDLVISALK